LNPHSLPGRDIVLVGAGHTNMHIVRMFRMNPIPDASLTLISPFGRATYSGMMPGTLAGLYSPDEMEIDLYRFAAPYGVRVIIDEVVGVDPERRRVLFRDRPAVRFDVASIGVGSVPAAHERWSSVPEVIPIKPMATFRARLNARLAELADRGIGRSAERPVQAVVAGGGAAGVEIAMCLEARLRSEHVPVEVTLVDSRDEILTGYLPGTVRRVHAEFSRRGIKVRSGSRIREIVEPSSEADRTSRVLVCEDGTTIPADVVLWVTGAAPSELIQNLALPKGDDGFLAVEMTLQTTAGSPVFAVGDSACLVESPVKKSGVYAVREGSVLWENLQRFLSGQRLQKYEPQRGFNSLLADGRGGAFIDYKRFSAHGQWAWRLKDRIDRKFMRMYQDYRPMPPQPARSTASETAAEFVMRCRGCGGKAGAAVLTTVFERLAAEHPERRHTAIGSPEDAARIAPATGQADLITIDFFQAFHDDPWLVGRVAALNSLSDIWATGGRPFGALAMIQIPEGHRRQQTELLYQLLSGALHEFELCDVELMGGHTTESSELTAGFTVLGSLDDRPPLPKAGAKPGDVLVLTKPLGTGILLAGLPRGITRAVWMKPLIDSMLKSNAAPAKLAREFEASALTDVTGFGLAGHLLEMLDASNVSATLDLAAVPLLPGVGDLNEQHVESTLAPSNREVESRFVNGSAEQRHSAEYAAMFDPQTSGGLLVALSPDRVSGFLERSREYGIEATAIGVCESLEAELSILLN